MIDHAYDTEKYVRLVTELEGTITVYRNLSRAQPDIKKELDLCARIGTLPSRIGLALDSLRKGGSGPIVTSGSYEAGLDENLVFYVSG